MADKISFQDIHRGICIIAQHMGDSPGLLQDIHMNFELSENYYHKVKRLNHGDLERAMKETLYEALGNSHSWEDFARILHYAMTQAGRPAQYQELLNKHNLEGFIFK